MQRCLYLEKEISTLETLLISSTPTEVEEFHLMNFTVVLTPSVFIALMKRLIFSSLDTTVLETEDSMLENLKPHSLLMMLSVTPKLPEDLPTILQDQSEEMIASLQELLMSSEACGEPSSELKMLQSLQDKDLLLDQVSTLMKLSILLT